jgi:alkylated DNA repair dioxygenase AlkB
MHPHENDDCYGCVPKGPHTTLGLGAIPGARYQGEFLSQWDETALLDVVDAHPWLPDLRRRVQHYGYRYNYRLRGVPPGAYLGPLPDWLSTIAAKLVASGFLCHEPDQAILNEYEPGQGIHSHIDCVPCFGCEIATISLGSACIMRFHQKRSDTTADFVLSARSVLILTGEARYAWTHAIPARKSDTINGAAVLRRRRVSITFRTVQRPGA